MSVKVFGAIVGLLLSILVAFSSAVLAKEVPGSDQGEAKAPYVESERSVLDKNVRVLRQSALATVNNNLAVLYADQGKVWFRADGKDLALDELKGVENLWLESHGKYVYAFWWVKFVYKDDKKTPVAGKTIFARSSDDYGKTFSPRVALTQGGGVLPSVSIAHDDQGHISIMWQDERNGGYEIYVNSSQDGGKTWYEDGKRLDQLYSGAEDPKKRRGDVERLGAAATSPHIGYIDNKLIATWQQLDAIDNKRVLRFISRISADHGGQWAVEREIERLEHPTHMESNFYSAGDGAFLAVSIPGAGLVLYSTVDGDVWLNLGAATGSEQLELASLVRMAAKPDLLLISYTGVPKTKLWRVETVRYDRKNKKWLDGVHRVDGLKEGEIYPRTSQQSLVLLENGYFCMSWESTAAIVPSIHFDCSEDGVTWFEDGPAVLTIPGYSHDSGAALLKSKDKLWVFYSRILPEGNKSAAVATMQELTLSEQGAPVLPKRVFKTFSEQERQELLKKRIQAFWDARVKGDLEAVWSWFDPVYRMKMNKYKWMAMQQNLTYFEYKLLTDEPLVLKGNFARAEVEMEVTARPAFVEEGFLEASVPKKTKASQLWGWFYDDWYLVPEGIFGNHLD